jgi:hypothetical protein
MHTYFLLYKAKITIDSTQTFPLTSYYFSYHYVYFDDIILTLSKHNWCFDIPVFTWICFIILILPIIFIYLFVCLYLFMKLEIEFRAWHIFSHILCLPLYHNIIYSMLVSSFHWNPDYISNLFSSITATIIVRFILEWPSLHAHKPNNPYLLLPTTVQILHNSKRSLLKTLISLVFSFVLRTFNGRSLLLGLNQDCSNAKNLLLTSHLEWGCSSFTKFQ